jgi:hypothetical protein
MRTFIKLAFLLIIIFPVPGHAKLAYCQTDTIKKIYPLLKKDWNNYPMIDLKVKIPNENDLQKSLVGNMGPDIIKPVTHIDQFILKSGDQEYTLDSLQVKEINPKWIKSISLIRYNSSKTDELLIFEDTNALIILKKRYYRRAMTKLGI